MVVQLSPNHSVMLFVVMGKSYQQSNVMMVILMEEMDVVNYVLWSNYMFAKEDH